MPMEDYENLEGENQQSQGQNTGNAEGEAASHQEGDQQTQTQTVPLQVVQSLREELKETKERARRAEYQAQIQSQQDSQQAQQAQQKADDPLADLEDDDFLTAGQARKIIQRTQQQNQQVMREIQIRQQLPDYDEVIQNDLPEIIQQKPHLRDAILSSGDPYSLAYELGKAHRQTKQGQQQPAQQEGQNASGEGEGQVEQGSELDQALQQQQQRPGSASQAAAASRGSVSQAARYDTMSPEEFEEEIRRARRGE